MQPVGRLSLPLGTADCPLQARDVVSLQGTLFFFFLAAPHSLQDLGSQPGMEPRAPAVEARSPNHWTTREFPREHSTEGKNTLQKRYCYLSYVFQSTTGRSQTRVNHSHVWITSFTNVFKNSGIINTEKCTDLKWSIKFWQLYIPM